MSINGWGKLSEEKKTIEEDAPTSASVELKPREDEIEIYGYIEEQIGRPYNPKEGTLALEASKKWKEAKEKSTLLDLLLSIGVVSVETLKVRIADVDGVQTPVVTTPNGTDIRISWNDYTKVVRYIVKP